MTRSCGLSPIARCHFIALRHFYVHVCYIHLVKDGFHTAGRGIGLAKVKVQNGSNPEKKEYNMTARM